MKLLKKIALMLDGISTPKTAYAHCDIPCGIYDPHLAQVTAHSVLRMTQLLKESSDGCESARYVAEKEKSAELVKQEVRIIWGDYLKPEHFEKYPQLHEQVNKIMKTASSARQKTDVSNAEELLEQVNKFAEIFWETKGIKTKSVKAPYPTEKEMILPDLQ